MGKVKFYTSSREKFDQLGIKDEDGIYFITDTHELYKGDNKIAGDFEIPIATNSELGGIKVTDSVDANWIQEHYPDLDIPGINLYTISDGDNAGKIFLHVDTDVFTDEDGIFKLKPATNHNLGGISSSIDFSSEVAAQIDTMISPDGTLYGIIRDGSITGNLVEGSVIPDNVSAFKNDMKYQTEEQVNSAISNAVSSAYKVKGSTTRDQLPDNAAIGDVYNLTDEDGMNVVWNGDSWDNLGSTVELTWDAISGKPSTFTPSAHRHDNVTSSIDGFMSSSDKVKLDGIAQYANNYILPSANSTNIGGIKAVPGTSGSYTTLNINPTTNFAYIDYATSTNAGTVKPGNYMSVQSDGTLDCNILWNELN